jgi:hypothetical protein
MSKYDAGPCGAVISTYDAKRLGAVYRVHFWDCFPRGLYVKFLRKRTKKKKILQLELLLPNLGEQCPTVASTSRCSLPDDVARRRCPDMGLLLSWRSCGQSLLAHDQAPLDASHTVRREADAALGEVLHCSEHDLICHTTKNPAVYDDEGPIRRTREGGVNGSR